MFSLTMSMIPRAAAINPIPSASAIVCTAARAPSRSSLKVPPSSASGR